ncbi:MAG: metal-dependent transcriptional regulator [Anaerovoracaceae bacterium]
MGLHESGEMYLETIHKLSRRIDGVRSIDVAKAMNFSKPSVSRAMSILKTDGMIEIDSAGFITLTDRGLSIAEKVYERHTVLTMAFEALGIDSATAEEDACRVEHVISEETFNAIKNHLHNISK